jgi:hypothetical protein
MTRPILLFAVLAGLANGQPAFDAASVKPGGAEFVRGTSFSTKGGPGDPGRITHRPAMKNRKALIAGIGWMALSGLPALCQSSSHATFDVASIKPGGDYDPPTYSRAQCPNVTPTPVV